MKPKEAKTFWQKLSAVFKIKKPRHSSASRKAMPHRVRAMVAKAPRQIKPKRQTFKQPRIHK